MISNCPLFPRLETPNSSLQIESGSVWQTRQENGTGTSDAWMFRRFPSRTESNPSEETSFLAASGLSKGQIEIESTWAIGLGRVDDIRNWRKE